MRRRGPTDTAGHERQAHAEGLHQQLQRELRVRAQLRLVKDADGAARHEDVGAVDRVDEPVQEEERGGLGECGG